MFIAFETSLHDGTSGVYTLTIPNNTYETVGATVNTGFSLAVEVSNFTTEEDLSEEDLQSPSLLFTITFHPEDGTVVPTTDQTNSTTGKLASLPTPTREGYTFDGWFDAVTGGTEVTTSTVFTKDTTIYAQWTRVSADSNKCTVTATSGSNGTISPTSVTVEKGGSQTFTFTPDSGYEVDKVTVNGSAVTVSGNRYTLTNVTADSTIHVTFQRTSDQNNAYTVTFDSNGGSSVANQTTNTSGLLSSLPSSTRTSYTLDGWYTASTGGTKITTSTAFTKNTTVYAQWTYVGSSSSSGSSSGSSTTTYTNSITTSEHGTVTLNPTAPEYGDSVTLTIAPNSGYEVGGVSVQRSSNGSDVTVTKQSDGTYRFIQPYGRVHVEVEFVKIGSSSNTEPSTPEVTPPDVSTTPSTTPRFSDTSSSDWFYDAVEFVSEKGLMNGTGEGKFSPYDSTTRGMVVTVLHSLAGYPEPSAQLRFHDVEDGEWFANAVTWANENKIANGVGEDAFQPNGNMTREQLVVMLYGYEKQFGAGEYEGERYLAFHDNDSISQWAEEAVAWSVAMGIVGGRDTGDFDPQATANRAEVAVILKNFVNLYHETI